MLRLRALSGAPLLALLACAPPNAATPYPTAEPPSGAEEAEPKSGAVRFLDREVDLQAFIAGFPYSHFEAQIEHDRLYYLETGERYRLRELALPPPGGSALALETGELVSETDWSTRSLWAVHLHAPSNALWLHADARNDEQMNLWRIDLSRPVDERTPEQITRADYVYGFGVSGDERHIAYLARSGKQAPYRTCLRLLDTTAPTQADRELVCDSPELSFTWSSPRFSPDGRRIYTAAQVEGDRKRVQIVEFDLDGAGKVELITDPAVPRRTPQLLKGWVDDEWLLYTSDERGFTNLYAWSRATRRHRQLSDLDEELLGAQATDFGVVLAHGTPAGSTLKLLDPRSGAVLGETETPGKIALLDGHGDRVVWTQEGPDQVFEASLIRLFRSDDGVDLFNDTLIQLPTALTDQLVQCKAEAVTVTSVDQRPLHVFVLRPREPLPSDRSVAMIRSFYGGANEWTRYDQVLCAAGITVISPAVRGSSGFGRDFASLNDGDLGGAEIVDLFSVARYVETELGIPPARIGVYGRSHGGYATLRAMTFPAEAAPEGVFPFGFGLAEAGFSDIEAFYAATNIPDWVVLEAGDPRTPEGLARLRERSPVHHVERLRAPVFLLHGSNDWRVPVAGSREFAERAKAVGKAVTYIEVEGQGHRIEGLPRIVDAWQARLDFIAKVVEATDDE